MSESISAYQKKSPPSLLPMRVWAVISIFAVFAGMLVLFLFNPREGHCFYPPCVFYRLTGLYCPGCGSTRCLYHLVHFDLLGAWRSNPFTVLALPYIGAHFFIFQIKCWTGRNVSLPFARPIFIWVIFIGIMAFWIARNIPVAPFNLLAPLGSG